MTGVSLDAKRTGFDLRELHSIEELEQVYRLLLDIWQADASSAPISVELMRALSHAGNYVAGAYDGERLVGAS
ncbi:GNAT family N-acetyltransferase, partial [Streptosporangium sp. NPDC051022]